MRATDEHITVPRRRKVNFIKFTKTAFIAAVFLLVAGMLSVAQVNTVVMRKERDRQRELWATFQEDWSGGMVATNRTRRIEVKHLAPYINDLTTFEKVRAFARGRRTFIEERHGTTERVKEGKDSSVPQPAFRGLTQSYLFSLPLSPATSTGTNSGVRSSEQEDAQSMWATFNEWFGTPQKSLCIDLTAIAPADNPGQMKYLEISVRFPHDLRFENPPSILFKVGPDGLIPVEAYDEQ